MIIIDFNMGTSNMTCNCVPLGFSMHLLDMSSLVIYVIFIVKNTELCNLIKKEPYFWEQNNITGNLTEIFALRYRM